MTQRRRDHGPQGGRRKVVIAPPGSAGKRPSDTPAAPRDEQAPPPVRRAVAEPVYIQRRHKAQPQTATRPALADTAAGGWTTANPTIARTTAVFIIGCNCESTVAERVAGWRATITSLGARWRMLDLGSTDGTYAAVAELRLDVLAIPGGRVRMMQTLDRAMESVDTDSVLFVDVAAEPHALARELLLRIDEGAALALPKVRRPGVVAVARGAWRDRPFVGSYDLLDWADGAGSTALLPTDGDGLPENSRAALGLVIDRRRRRHARRAAWRALQKTRIAAQKARTAAAR